MSTYNECRNFKPIEPKQLKYVIAELKKEVEPVKEKCPCCGAELKSLKKG